MQIDSVFIMRVVLEDDLLIISENTTCLLDVHGIRDEAEQLFLLFWVLGSYLSLRLPFGFLSFFIAHHF